MINVVALGSVASVKSGYAFKSKDWTDGGVPVIKIANIKDGFIELDGCSYVREPVAAAAKAFELNPGDVLISMTGYIGEIARVRNEGRMLLNQRVGKFTVLNPSELDSNFLFYCLRDPAVKAKLAGRAYGAAQPNISPALIEQQEIPLPNIATQRRIVDILSAYDDLIENCQRRIEILEQMARALYREWFVKFRYPGHESVPLVSSPLGEIPQGWDVSSIASTCARLESGGTPRRNNAELWDNGDVDWYTTSELQDNFLLSSKEKITEKAVLTSNARVFESGTILMAIYGSPTVGRLGVLTRRSSCNQAALGLVADSRVVSQNYLYFALQALRTHFNSIAQGAAQQNISKEKVANTMIVVPDSGTLERFEAVSSALRDETRVLTETVRNLRRIRDLLLPRLISGQLAVDAA